MKIEILQLIDGAKKARGTTVIIDVFRAMTLEAYFLSGGAKYIVPTGSEEKAYALKRENPDYILAGERHGKILPGFDTGNSPSQLSAIDFKGKAVIHTTSAGTQGIANAARADEILCGSLVTARATAEYILKKNPERVSLVCMGLEALKETEEDTLCAEYIKSILEGRERDISEDIKSLKFTSGAKFFDEKQKDVFPEEDFFLCTQLNKFDFVVRYDLKKHITEKVTL